jgi:NADPH:quinone reductase-like Zn-dependent oxidoreductase
MTTEALFAPSSTAVGFRTKACRVHAFGPPANIILEDVDLREPGPGELLVRVGAAGVGPWDGWIRAGKSVLPQPLPLTLGSDLSGTVTAVGPGVTGFAPGDAVFGVTNERFVGAYAEHAIVSAGMVAHKPKRFDHVDAASVPVIAVTAWQALYREAHLKADQTVLVHGAAGNVGAYAVQFAHQAGARVIATASADDADYVRSLGADLAVDYRADRFEDVAKDVDIVVDLVGGETQTRSFTVMKRGGVLASAVSAPDASLAAQYGVKAGFFLVAVNTADLTRIAALLDADCLQTNVGAILPLAGARRAHEMLEGTRSRPRGKIVLNVAS